MNLKNKLVLIILFIFTTAGYAQETEIGLIPTYRGGDSKALFIDADAGEIVGFAAFEEPVWMVKLSDDEASFYALSRNTLYKGDVVTGEIVDKYQFMEILEQSPSDLTDPNLNIFPLGVTSTGKALYSYNEKLFNLTKRQSEISSKMSGASMSEINKLSKELNGIASQLGPLYTLMPTFLVDLNTKTKQNYQEFDHRGEKYAGITMDNYLQTFDLKTNKLYLKDIETKDVIKEYDINSIYTEKPNLKSYMPGTQSMVSKNLMNCIYFDPKVALHGTSVLFDVMREEIVLSYDFTSAMEMMYPVYYENCSEYKIAKKTCDIGPMPGLPDFGTPSGTSKSKMAEWQEQMKKKQVDHQKALKEWQDKATNPENCNTVFYSDAQLTNKTGEIENAAGGVIYRDNYFLVVRNFEVAMYDLETQEMIWSVDTDF